MSEENDKIRMRDILYGRLHNLKSRLKKASPDDDGGNSDDDIRTRDESEVLPISQFARMRNHRNANRAAGISRDLDLANKKNQTTMIQRFKHHIVIFLLELFGIGILIFLAGLSPVIGGETVNVANGYLLLLVFLSLIELMHILFSADDKTYLKKMHGEIGYKGMASKFMSSFKKKNDAERDVGAEQGIEMDVVSEPSEETHIPEIIRNMSGISEPSEERPTPTHCGSPMESLGGPHNKFRCTVCDLILQDGE